MTDSPSDLIDGYLDDLLSPAQEAELVAWIKSDPAQARQFARAVLLHDRLQAAVRAVDDLGDTDEPAAAIVVSRRPQLLRRRAALAAQAACLLLAAGLIGWRLSGDRLLAANDELHRILRAQQEASTRTFLVTALDGEASLRSPVAPRGQPQPSADDAVLHVRGPDRYVLVRRFPDGTSFVTGYDGTHSWSVPPQGPVRVSTDPRRFRGALPGERHAIPFVDLRASLQQLEEAYAVRTLEKSSREGLRELQATRKGSAYGGPKSVTIWYDGQTRRIQAMLLDRLPQARGGPRSVLLERIDEADRGPDFFDHPAHHEPTREVLEE
jgi:hypothetical protein